MIILTETNNGHVSAARSDDGQVTATRCPTTTLYGEFALVDAEGRSMWRGVYCDGAGMATDEQVPPAIWESACGLMQDWNSYARKREDASTERALQQDMDRPDSDL